VLLKAGEEQVLLKATILTSLLFHWWKLKLAMMW
jgi:hypothetical protein